jgi:SOS-response transcriptional repressor LexA
MTLTDRQRAIVAAVHDYSAEHGYPPSIPDIASEIGSAWSTAWGHVQALICTGLLEVDPHRCRTVRLAPDIAVSRNGQVARVVWTAPGEETARLINDLHKKTAAADGAATADRTATTTEESSP